MYCTYFGTSFFLIDFQACRLTCNVSCMNDNVSSHCIASGELCWLANSPCSRRKLGWVKNTRPVLDTSIDTSVWNNTRVLFLCLVALETSVGRRAIVCTVYDLPYHSWWTNYMQITWPVQYMFVGWKACLAQIKWTVPNFCECVNVSCTELLKYCTEEKAENRWLVENGNT